MKARRLTWLAVVLGLATVAPSWGATRAERYTATLQRMADALLATQVDDPASPDDGALVCPSVNPQPHPLHSRAAEAVYPLAVLYQRRHDARYRDAAARLARWLLGKQQPNGAWGEAWPGYDGWAGTTADQLISLAGAYPLLAEDLTPADREAWARAMRAAADYVVRTFPVGNINYSPTGAVALRLTAQALHDPVPAWLTKADALLAETLAAVNDDGLLNGEGGGVDLGYNLAQSIGYLALYGDLINDDAVRERAAELLRTHAAFVYPNGAVDNSWGTRSYKWTFESGTKTAPGVYFSFALLADREPTAAALGDRCLDYLETYSWRDGLVTAGPHATRATSLDPPCLYGTFARAQSIALALAYAPIGWAEAESSAVAAELREAAPSWRFFPTVQVAVVRTEGLMATVSAYGAIGRYGRGQVSRGGSLTCLWLDGYGGDGLAQVASVTRYRREEGIHMPEELADRPPLTPRADCTIDGVDFSNLFEADGVMTVVETGGVVDVTTRGELRSVDGMTSGVTYVLSHQFGARQLRKEWTLYSPRATIVRLIEPMLVGEGEGVGRVTPQSVTFRSTRAGPDWVLAVEAAPADATVSWGAAAESAWAPFPGAWVRSLVVAVPVPAGKAIRMAFSLRAAER